MAEESSSEFNAHRAARRQCSHENQPGNSKLPPAPLSLRLTAGLSSGSISCSVEDATKLRRPPLFKPQQSVPEVAQVSSSSGKLSFPLSLPLLLPELFQPLLLP